MSVKRRVACATVDSSKPYVVTVGMLDLAHASQGGTEARSSQGCRRQRARICSHGESYCFSCTPANLCDQQTPYTQVRHCTGPSRHLTASSADWVCLLQVTTSDLQGESKTKLAAGVKPLAGGGGIFKSAAVEVLRQERRLMTTGEITK